METLEKKKTTKVDKLWRTGRVLSLIYEGGSRWDVTMEIFPYCR